MREALRLAEDGVHSSRGGPFGCVIVHRGVIVGRGQNAVTSANDPTAHAEIVAIRDAARTLGRFHLDDCELYTSCEPCPMCLAAILWAHIPAVYYGNTGAAAAAIGFDDEFIRQQLLLPPGRRRLKMTPLLGSEAEAAFRAWSEKTDKVQY